MYNNLRCFFFSFFNLQVITSKLTLFVSDPSPVPPSPSPHTHTFHAGHPILQLRVIACFLILISGRVINVYVPIYYKRIINALTPGPPNTTSSLDLSMGFTSQTTGITLPLASILIYVFLRFLQVTIVGCLGHRCYRNRCTRLYVGI